ncbi:unnamed protein product [Echinostoma caproni]|uniref:DNA-directed RNA polymerase n=1 Tax=Echinostoma caproni TaxID=27848 RepID=A0A183AL64_9TREM|nr:unnamed protein product [Echinostoma caproni]
MERVHHFSDGDPIFRHLEAVRSLIPVILDNPVDIRNNNKLVKGKYIVPLKAPEFMPDYAREHLQMNSLASEGVALNSRTAQSGVTPPEMEYLAEEAAPRYRRS